MSRPSLHEEIMTTARQRGYHCKVSDICQEINQSIHGNTWDNNSNDSNNNMMIVKDILVKVCSLTGAYNSSMFVSNKMNTKSKKSKHSSNNSKSDDQDKDTTKSNNSQGCRLIRILDKFLSDPIENSSSQTINTNTNPTSNSTSTATTKTATAVVMADVWREAGHSYTNEEACRIRQVQVEFLRPFSNNNKDKSKDSKSTTEQQLPKYYTYPGKYLSTIFYCIH